MTTIHLLHALEGLLAAGMRLYALGSELLSVGALLWILATLATLIERTWKAGYALGDVYFRHLKPALASIDWALVASIVGRGLIALAVGTYTLGRMLGLGVHTLSAALGAAHVRLLGLQAAAPALVAPLLPAEAPTPALVALPSTVVALRALARERGIPSRQWRSARKAVLVELLAA